jgi:hypothetical protein
MTATTIKTAAQADGTITYRVSTPPCELPPVLARDLLAAWEHARAAARSAIWSVARVFRFHAADGTVTDLALHDEDACCWAGAVDRSLGMQTGYGLSVCLRLLALVDLLAHASWATALVDLDADGAELHPALLRAASVARLTPDARFDEHRLRASLDKQDSMFFFEKKAAPARREPKNL